MTKIILKSSDYKYPSTEERKDVESNYPRIENFGFEYVSEIKSIFDNNPLESVKRESYLFHWDICLLNKLGKLHETYIFLVTNYNRGVPDKFDETTIKEYLNSHLFDYYAEIFYYYYFSVRDNIGQILNVYFNLNFEENEVYFNKIASKISDIKVREIIEDFINLTTKISKFRNAFAHRFPLNYPDYRPNLSQKDGNKIYSGGRGDYIKPSEFIDNINESLSHLEKFMRELKLEIKPKH